MTSRRAAGGLCRLRFLPCNPGPRGGRAVVLCGPDGSTMLQRRRRSTSRAWCSPRSRGTTWRMIVSSSASGPPPASESGSSWSLDATSMRCRRTAPRGRRCSAKPLRPWRSLRAPVTGRSVVGGAGGHERQIRRQRGVDAHSGRGRGPPFRTVRVTVTLLPIGGRPVTLPRRARDRRWASNARSRRGRSRRGRLRAGRCLRSALPNRPRGSRNRPRGWNSRAGASGSRPGIGPQRRSTWVERGAGRRLDRRE